MAYTLTRKMLIYLYFFFSSVDLWPFYLQPVAILEFHSVQCLNLQLVCGQRRQVPCCDVTTELLVTHERPQSQANNWSVLVLRIRAGYFRYVWHKHFKGKQRQLFDMGSAIRIFCRCARIGVHHTGSFSCLRERKNLLHSSSPHEQDPRTRDFLGFSFDAFRGQAQPKRSE